MPGLRIEIDTASSERGIRRLNNDLTTLGARAVGNERQMRRLEERMTRGLQADRASAAIDRLGRSINLTRIETARLRAGIGDYSGALRTMTEGVGNATKNIALMGAAMTAAAVASSVKLIDTFGDFETALNDMGKVTKRSQAELREEIMKMSPVLGSATDLMEGYYQTISAGVTDPVKSLDFLTTSAKAANAAHVEQGEVVKALSKLMAGYAGDIKKTSDAADLLFSIEKEGQTSVSELVPVIGDLAAVSHEVGVRQTEMAGALALMTQTSGSTSEAATKYKAILIGLYKPQSEMQKILKATGYTSGVAMVKQLGLAGALDKVKKEAAKTGTGLGKLFESQEALIGISALSVNSFETMAEKEKAIVDGAGSMEAAFVEWQKTMEATEAVFNNTIGKFAIEFGGELAPAMKEGMVDFTAYIEDHREELLAFFEGVGESAKNLSEVGVRAADFLSKTLAGWNALPPVIQDVGLVAAVFGGVKGKIAIATVIGLTAVVQTRMEKLVSTAGDLSLGFSPQPMAEGLDAMNVQLKKLEDARDRFLDLNPAAQMRIGMPHIESITDQIEELEDAIEDYNDIGFLNLESWDAFQNQGVEAVGNTVDATDDAVKNITESYEKIEDRLKKAYEKSLEYQLLLKKKELETYQEYEKKKPEYVAMIQAEISTIYGKMYAAQASAQKKALAAQQREIKSFYDDYDKATLTSFEFQEKKLIEKYFTQLELARTSAVKMIEVDDWYLAELKKLKDKKTDEEKKESDKRLKEQDKLHREYLKKEQDAYDALYEKAEGFTDRMINNWDDMGTALVSMAEDMFKDIAAAFLTKTIVMPIYMSVIGSTGVDSSGTDGTGSTGLVSGVSSLYNSMSNNTAQTVSNVLQSEIVGSLGESVFGAELWGTYGGIEAGTGAVASSGIVGALVENSLYGVLGNLGYTYIGDWLGLPQSEYSGLGAGIGAIGGAAAGTAIAGSAAGAAVGTAAAGGAAVGTAAAGGAASGISSGAAGGSWAGPVGAVVGAIVGGLAAALLGGSDDPDLRLGLFHSNETFENDNRTLLSDDYNYMLATQDTDASNYQPIIDYYDEIFKTLDEETTASINEIIGNADTGIYGRIGWFDIEGMDYEEIISAMNDSLFDALHDGLVKDIGEGIDPGVFDINFFESIQDGEEVLLDTYLNFRDTVETMGIDDFLDQFNYQMTVLGLTAEEAYENMQNIATVITALDDAAYSLSTTDTLTTLGETILSWEVLTLTLEAAKATTEQLADAEKARNEIVGSDITGLTAETIRENVLSGGDISAILESQINNLASSVIAEDIYNNFISEMNEEVGAVFADSDYDLNAVIEYLNNIDTTDAQNEILEMQEAFGLIEVAVIDISDASRIVTLAIDGLLSSSQQFQAWEIENIEALALYTEMTAASVTREELESAIEAFVDLGLEGDQLNTVIQDLADRFTDATDQLLQSISDIEDAQDNLTGDADSSSYLDEIESVLSYFQNIPTMGQIRGDEPIDVFDPDAYMQAFTDFVVESEFQDILGRGPSSDFWTDALLDPDSGIDFSNIHESIIAGIDTPDDVVDEIFNRLFGRSASGDYWSDALSDPESGINLGNIEESIIAGASPEDAAYLAEHGGEVVITNWQDFEDFSSIEEHLNQYGSTIQEFINSVSDPTFTEEQLVEGDYTTSEEEILAAIALLEGLPDVISDGVLDEDALNQFIDTIGGMDSAVLEDIFGEGAADQINELAAAVDEYNESLEESSTSAAESAALAESILAKERSLSISILETQGESELALAMQREDTISDLIEQYGSESDGIIALQEELWALEDATDAAEFAESVLAEKRSIGISILEAQGESEAALAMQREDTIISLTDQYGDESDSIIALQEELWALEDAADAATEAENALSEAESNRESAAQEYRSALQEELDILENDLEDAKNTYLGLLNDELSAQEELADSMRAAAESMKDFRESIWTDDDSPYNEETRQDILFSQIKSLYADAMGGDTESMSELIEVSDQYLSLTKDTSSTWEDYQREAIRISTMLSEVEFFAGNQADDAETQVELLQRNIDSVNGVEETITDINIAREAWESAQTILDNNWYTEEIEKLDSILDATLSLNELMQNFNIANDEYIKLGGTVPDVTDSTDTGDTDTGANTGTNISDLQLYSTEMWKEAANVFLSGDQNDISSVMDTLQVSNIADLGMLLGYAGDDNAFADMYGLTEGFATGGSFSVSGRGGKDSLSLPNLRVTAGEIVNISRPDVMAELTDEIQSLRAQVAKLTEEVESGTEVNKKVLSINDKWDKIGIPTRIAS